MNPTINQLALSDDPKSVILTKGKGHPKPKTVLALQADIAQLGFHLDKKVIAVLKTFTDAEVKQFHTFIVKELSVAVGAHVKYVPLFKNFPTDIPEDGAYFFRRIIGFLQNVYTEVEGTKLSCGCSVDAELFDVDLFGACPICQFQAKELLSDTVKKTKLKDKVKLKPIYLTTREKLDQRFQNLMSAKSSLSQNAKTSLALYFTEVKDDVEKLLPKEMPIKENMAVVSGLLLQQTSLSYKYVKNWVSTATDVLRIAVQLSQGDVSLKENTKFKLKNKERNFIIKLLNGIESPEEDMMRRRQTWLRLGEYLHIGTKKETYPSIYSAFNRVRNHHTEIETFNKKAHASLVQLTKTHEAPAVVSLLKTRPGEFARKIDMILRESNDPKVVEEFAQVVNNVATPILLKLNKHLQRRVKPSPFRYFVPKGNVAKIHVLESDERKPISKQLITKTSEVVTNELLRRFKTKMGAASSCFGHNTKRVFIDPALKNYIVPLTQRSASKAMSTVERGSQIAIGDAAKVVRFFIYWHEGPETGRIDLDLSATGYDEDWDYVDHISWTHLTGVGGVHSGDIQSAPHGASEFVDIDVSVARKKFRYLVMQVYGYTGQTFDTFEAFAGFMERQKPGSGEIYDPKTVKNKFDLSSDTTICMPMILDLETNQVIWADIGITGRGRGSSVDNSHKKVAQMGKALVAMKTDLPNLFDLFSLHSEARGGKVETVLKADVKYDAIIHEEKAKDYADITANYL